MAALGADMQQSRLQGSRHEARVLDRSRVSMCQAKTRQPEEYTFRSAPTPAGDLTGPTLVPATDASPVPKLEPSVQMIGAKRQPVPDLETNATEEDAQLPANKSSMTGAPVQHEDNTVALFGKAASTIQLVNALCIQYWCILAAGNTVVACLAAFIASQPGAANILMLGAFSTAVMAIALKMVQFSVSCFLQGLKGLRYDENTIQFMEQLAESVMKLKLAHLQPDHEEQPTPTFQFFFSGTIVTFLGCCLTKVIKDCLQLYPEFQVSRSVAVLPAACGAGALTFGISACLLVSMRGLWRLRSAV